MDSAGYLYIVLPDNAAKKLNLKVKGAKHYNVGVNPTKHKLIHATHCTALTDSRPDRLNLGVGEYVNFSFTPPVDMPSPEQPTWTASAGSVSPSSGSSILFTAPSNAASAKIVVKVRDAKLETKFSVKEPTGYDHADITATNSYGVCGVEMKLRVYIKPTSVSFCRVWIEELEVDASQLSGYWLTNNPPMTPHELRHRKWGRRVQLGEDNSWTDTAAGATPVYPTGMTWEIPVIWSMSAADGETNPMTVWSQVMSADSSGTFRVEKFDHSAECTLGGVITAH